MIDFKLLPLDNVVFSIPLLFCPVFHLAKLCPFAHSTVSKAVKLCAESKYPMMKMNFKQDYVQSSAVTDSYLIDILSCDGFKKTRSNEENAYTS